LTSRLDLTFVYYESRIHDAMLRYNIVERESLFLENTMMAISCALSLSEKLSFIIVTKHNKLFYMLLNIKVIIRGNEDLKAVDKTISVI
jgi:hypothetical protein